MHTLKQIRMLKTAPGETKEKFVQACSRSRKAKTLSKLVQQYSTHDNMSRWVQEHSESKSSDTKHAMKLPKNNMAPDPNNVPAEAIKADGHNLSI